MLKPETSSNLSMTSSKLFRSASQKSSDSASSTIAWSSTASPSAAIAKAPAVRPNGRALLRIAGVLLLFGILGPVHILTKALFGRSPWPQRFLAGVTWIAGARARLDGQPIRGHTLLLSNHISWLDIVV